MRLSKMWGDFERAIINASSNDIYDILYSAAMKRKIEIESNEDLEINDSFINNIVNQAIRRKRSPIEQLRYIKRYEEYENQ
jgi:hypothetical protein